MKKNYVKQFFVHLVSFLAIYSLLILLLSVLNVVIDVSPTFIKIAKTASTILTLAVSTVLALHGGLGALRGGINGLIFFFVVQLIGVGMGNPLTINVVDLVTYLIVGIISGIVAVNIKKQV